MNSDNPRVKPRMRSSRGVLRPARSVETTALPAAVPILGAARWRGWHAMGSGSRIAVSSPLHPSSGVIVASADRGRAPHDRGRAVDHAGPARDHAGRAGAAGRVPGHLPAHDRRRSAPPWRRGRSRTRPGSRRGTSPSPGSTSTRWTPTSRASAACRGRGASRSTRRRRRHPCVHVLLGINAHINYDLPQALLAVISDDDFADPARRRPPASRPRAHRRRAREPGRRRGPQARRSTRPAACSTGRCSR